MGKIKNELDKLFRPMINLMSIDAGLYKNKPGEAIQAIVGLRQLNQILLEYAASIMEIRANLIKNFPESLQLEAFNDRYELTEDFISNSGLTAEQLTRVISAIKQNGFENIIFKNDPYRVVSKETLKKWKDLVDSIETASSDELELLAKFSQELRLLRL